MVDPEVLSQFDRLAARVTSEEASLVLAFGRRLRLEWARCEDRVARNRRRRQHDFARRLHRAWSGVWA